MFKKNMGEAVQRILYTANYIWELVGCMDEVVELVRSAKLICITYNLKELKDVHKFENRMLEEWKEYQAKEAESELKARFSEGFADGIIGGEKHGYIINKRKILHST